MTIELVVLLILIFINAFFAASEIALISLNDSKIKMMADSGDKKAMMLEKLLSEPSRFLATIQIGITLAGFLASAFAAESFAARGAEYLFALGVPLNQSLLENISVIVITIILSYFTLVFGELVPKRLALTKAEEIAMFAVTPLTLLSKLSAPFVKLLTGSTNVTVRLFGVDPNREPTHVTEEEIRMLIDVGKEKGTIQETEKEMIHNIFEFDNKRLSEIITHRIDIVAIPVEATLAETLKIAYDEKFTRYPVYEGNIDRIIGILHIKDLLKFAANTKRDDFNLRDLIREPYFVVESIKTDQLFKEMQQNNIQMAIVLDEYGGTAGIATIEDLVEEIVGNIFDEYDDREDAAEEIVKVDANTFLIEGIVSLDEVEKLLEIDLPVDEYETLSGFVIGLLKYFPEMNEHPSINYQNFSFKVEEMSERRIEKIKITKNEDRGEEPILR